MRSTLEHGQYRWATHKNSGTREMVEIRRMRINKLIAVTHGSSFHELSDFRDWGPPLRDSIEFNQPHLPEGTPVSFYDRFK